jgi:LPS-assembly protein
VTTTGQNQSSTRFLAQLTFKGLSSVDNGLMTAFRTGVAGYTPLPPPPPPESRFTNYE